MKIALIGYGKMGHAIEEIAIQRGHTIKAKIDDHNLDQLPQLESSEIDVAIEFTSPEAVLENVRTCISSGIPVISGTTGWNDRMKEIIEFCKQEKGTFFYASNFSLGVNILFEVNRRLAEIMNRFEDYSVDMTEIHHIQKMDSPSGTAITLAEVIIENIERVKNWKLDGGAEGELGIQAIRENEVPGKHVINYENDIDRITVSHEAKTRKGFALGAVFVSEWIKGRKGFFTMKDFLDL